MADVGRLSGPVFHGRLTGTTDDRQSATVIATEFSALGLQPFAPESSWIMATDVPVHHIAPNPTLNYQIASSTPFESAQVGQDYVPILDSPPIHLTAALVFVGYGISDAAHGWDEYAGMDVRGRIVVFLRGKPESYAPPVSHADKVRVAREKGAAAFLTFTGPIISPYEVRRGMGHTPLAFYNQVEEGASLAGAWIHTDLGERLLSGGLTRTGRSLREVQQQLHTMTSQSWETGVMVRLEWERTEERGTLHNVVGMMPAPDGSSADETVVIGAHRDHFGEQAGLLFAGADDNASGTAVLLEVARVLAESHIKPKRSLLFISFSGEEQGLLGSRFYVNQPVRALSKTVAMINIDHAGVGSGRLTIGVAGLEKPLAAKAGEQVGLADKLDLFGFFPGGDHVPFKEAGVPTLTVVSGGAHPYFHQPSDTLDTIHPEILELTARYVLALVWQLVN